MQITIFVLEKYFPNCRKTVMGKTDTCDRHINDTMIIDMTCYVDP